MPLDHCDQDASYCISSRRTNSSCDNPIIACVTLVPRQSLSKHSSPFQKAAPIIRILRIVWNKKDRVCRRPSPRRWRLFNPHSLLLRFAAHYRAVSTVRNFLPRTRLSPTPSGNTHQDHGSRQWTEVGRTVQIYTLHRGTRSARARPKLSSAIQSFYGESCMAGPA